MEFVPEEFKTRNHECFQQLESTKEPISTRKKYQLLTNPVSQPFPENELTEDLALFSNFHFRGVQGFPTLSLSSDKTELSGCGCLLCL